MKKHELEQYFNEWLAGELSPDQAQDLYKSLQALEDHELEALLRQRFDQLEPLAFFSVDEKKRMADRIVQVQTSGARVRRLRFLAAAAVILLALVAGAFFLAQQDRSEPTAVVQRQDVAPPQTTRATITLADGRKVLLDSLTAMTEAGAVVTRDAEGAVSYELRAVSTTEIAYNTLSNPRGSKVVSLTLSDGTKVWLNAESSLKYPVAFVGKERRVSITGEAYFEVAHDAGKSFFVSKGDMQVQVLGTHFNVNAYDDEENIRITLLEGSVKVSKAGLSGMLKPGQQAQIDGTIRLMDNADLDQVMAWKNGIFKFNGSDVESVMKQLSRWYDVEIVYEGQNPVANFRGTISRQNNISEILKMLELTKAVKFKVEGKKVIVSK